MHIHDLDLNLLRLFDAVYLERNVSRAAERLNLTQPTASQGLMRLRLALGDPLFERAPGGVRPTPRAERLAGAVQQALSLLGEALTESAEFRPLESNRVFRLHLSDIGEARFLPDLMGALRERAPGVRLETRPWAHPEVAPALDSGRLDIALGFLPTVADTRKQELLQDRYIVLLRQSHPFVKARAKAMQAGNLSVALEELHQLEYAAVRSHADTLRILHLLKLEDRLRLTAAHFLALPDIVKAVDVGVLMPRSIAEGFAVHGGYVLLEPDFPLRDFMVSMHWSSRFEADPALTWLRAVVVELFAVRQVQGTRQRLQFGKRAGFGGGGRHKA